MNKMQQLTFLWPLYNPFTLIDIGPYR